MNSEEGLNPELREILDNIGKDISDATIPKSHVAITRDILEYLNELSVDLGYNQNLADWLFDDDSDKQIDRKFPIFLRLVVPHHFKAGEPTDTHYRMIWEFVFTDDYENSHTGMLDIPAEAYNLLPEVPDIWVSIGEVSCLKNVTPGLPPPDPVPSAPALPAPPPPPPPVEPGFGLGPASPPAFP